MVTSSLLAGASRVLDAPDNWMDLNEDQLRAFVAAQSSKPQQQVSAVSAAAPASGAASGHRSVRSCRFCTGAHVAVLATAALPLSLLLH